MSLDLQLTKAVKGVLGAVLPEGTTIGEVHDTALIAFPCVLLDVTSDSLLNSPFWTGNITAQSITQADESTLDEHSALSILVGQTIENMVLNGPDIKTCGRVISTRSENRNTDRHWTTLQTFKLGFGPVTA